MKFDNWLMPDAALNLETQLPLSLSKQRSFQSTQLYCHTLQFNLRGCRRFCSSEQPSAQGAKSADEKAIHWLMTGRMSQVEVWTYPFSTLTKVISISKLVVCGWRCNHNTLLQYLSFLTSCPFPNGKSVCPEFPWFVQIFMLKVQGNYSSILHLVHWRWYKLDRARTNYTSRKN